MPSGAVDKRGDWMRDGLPVTEYDACHSRVIRDEELGRRYGVDQGHGVVDGPV
jgi:hypothetical protein